MIPCCFFYLKKEIQNQFLKYIVVLKRKEKKLGWWMVSKISVLKKKRVGFVLCVNATGHLH